VTIPGVQLNDGVDIPQAGFGVFRIPDDKTERSAPEDLEFTEIPSGTCALQPDFDADYSPAAVELKEAIRHSDAVLFVTPEYNRSIPGALKNATTTSCGCSRSCRGSRERAPPVSR